MKLKTIRAGLFRETRPPCGTIQARSRHGSSWSTALSFVALLATCPCSTSAAAADIPALLREAIAHHPSIRSQQGLQAAAEAGVSAARWSFWPTPSIASERAGTGQNDAVYRGGNTVTTVRLQQPLWTGGRLSGHLDRAQALALAAQADFETARQRLALRIVESASDILVAQLKLDAYRQSRDVHARLLAMVERRTREGASAQADVHLAHSRLDAIEADLQSARAQRDTGLDRLRLLVGRQLAAESPDARLPPHLDTELDLDPLLASARQHSPQLIKAHAQAKVAEAEIGIARAALSPEIYVRVERQWGSFNAASQAPQNRVFVGMSTAFGGGLSSLSGIQAAQARHDAARDDIEAQQLAIDEQIQGDLILFRTAGTRRAGLERARRSAAEVSASWERQFLAGRKQWQDLMNAARELAQNDAQLADAIGAQYLTGWRLTLLAQGVDGVLDDALAARQAASGAEPSAPPPTGTFR
ncbi:TolC family protein [Pseudorhodoferax sp.]|uniref:TolC family protein n=1 Tax=Pseudorhodoferax sp. TaxID=1993553 RepID=UPI0039E3355B